MTVRLAESYPALKLGACLRAFAPAMICLDDSRKLKLNLSSKSCNWWLRLGGNWGLAGRTWRHFREGRRALHRIGFIFQWPAYPLDKEANSWR